MNYKFELDEKQIERYKEWLKTLPKLGNGHFGARKIKDIFNSIK